MTKFFHLSKTAQRVLALVLIGLITLYLVAIVWDFSKYYALFLTNDKIVEKDMDNNGYSYLTEVASYGDGVVNVKGKATKTLTVEGDSIVYTAYMQSPEWYYYDVEEQDTLDSLIYTNYDDFVKTAVSVPNKTRGTASGDASEKADAMYKVTFSDKSTATVKRDSPIYYVTIKDNGNFEVTFASGRSVTVKEIPSIDKGVYKNGKYRLKVRVGYTRTITSTEVNLCTKLPTNSIYFDAKANQLVRNVGTNFYWTFVYSAKAYWVIILSILMVIIAIIEHHRAPEKQSLAEWGTKPYRIGFSLLLVMIFVVLTILLALCV